MSYRERFIAKTWVEITKNAKGLWEAVIYVDCDRNDPNVGSSVHCGEFKLFHSAASAAQGELIVLKLLDSK